MRKSFELLGTLRKSSELKRNNKMNKLLLLIILFSPIIFAKSPYDCPTGNNCKYTVDQYCISVALDGSCSGELSTKDCISYAPPNWCFNEANFYSCLRTLGPDYLRNRLLCSRYNRNRAVCMEESSYPPRNGKC